MVVVAGRFMVALLLARYPRAGRSSRGGWSSIRETARIVRSMPHVVNNPCSGPLDPPRLGDPVSKGRQWSRIWRSGMAIACRDRTTRCDRSTRGVCCMTGQVMPIVCYCLRSIRGRHVGDW